MRVCVVVDVDSEITVILVTDPVDTVSLISVSLHAHLYVPYVLISQLVVFVGLVDNGV